MGATSSTALGTGILALKAGMDLSQCRLKSLCHLREGSRQSRPPPDQHIVVAGLHRAPRSRKPHHFAQAATNPVAFDGTANLPRHRETDAYGTLISPTTRLQDECAACRALAAGSGPKIAPAS